MLKIIENKSGVVNEQLRVFQYAQETMAESAEIFLENSRQALKVGDQKKADDFFEKSNECSTMKKLFGQLCQLILKGFDIEEAKTQVNFNERNNQFLAKQASWFAAAGFSQETIDILTAPIGV